MPPTPPRSPYHHGDLRRALLDTGVELAREHGPSAVTVREAARRIGVSPSAAYRHFAAHSDLLAAVAGAAVQELAARMRAAVAAADSAGDDPDDPNEPPAQRAAAMNRFRSVGLAYVEFALDSPGLFRTGYASDAAPDELGDGVAVSDHPQLILAEMLDELVALGALAPEQRRDADAAAWSGVHGLAVLMLDGLLGREGTDRQALIDSTLDMIGIGLCAPALYAADPLPAG